MVIEDLTDLGVVPGGRRRRLTRPASRGPVVVDTGAFAAARFEHPLAVLADPAHEEQDHPWEWRGPFGPEAFDLALVNLRATGDADEFGFT